MIHLRSGLMIQNTQALKSDSVQIGESDSGILVVVFTVRGKGRTERYRLISARKANRKERALYEINKRISV